MQTDAAVKLFLIFDEVSESARLWCVSHLFHLLLRGFAHFQNKQETILAGVVYYQWYDDAKIYLAITWAIFYQAVVYDKKERDSVDISRTKSDKED